MSHAPRARRGRSRFGQGGFSLVELMVALTLGAILLGGAVTLFVNNRETYNITTDIARVQENARFTLEMLLRDIRMAGYLGCSNSVDRINYRLPDRVLPASTPPPGVLWDITNPLEGFDDAFDTANAVPVSWKPSGRAITVGHDGDNGQVLPGTDAITLRYMQASSDANGNGVLDFQVTAIPGAGSLTVDDATAFRNSVNFPIGVADCASTDIALLSAAPTGNDLQPSVLTKTFVAGPQTVVAPVWGARYYIGNTTNNARNVRPALYRTIIGLGAGGAVAEAPPVQLFEGIESMQILYGVDLDADGAPDIYMQAGDRSTFLLGGSNVTADLSSTVGNTWKQVVVVRIGLLIRTVDEFGRDLDTRTYSVLEANLGPFNDRRRRRVFTTTAVVRNFQ